MSDLPPSIPTELQIYDSYSIDPQWQRYFTYAWVAFAGVCMLCSFNYVRRLATNGRGWAISETQTPPHSESRLYSPSAGLRKQGLLARLSLISQCLAQSTFAPSAPIFRLRRTADCCRKRYLPLTVGQLVIVLGYTAAVLVCILKDAELSQNSNRAGFLALAQLTPVFLLATKNNPIGLLLGIGYERLNWAHRWAGRLLWLSATIHGALWIHQFRSTGQWSQLGADKSQRGIAAYVLLTALAALSISPLRSRFYQVFKALHVASFVGFFAAICYHTPYSIPWIYPPVALYAADLFFRLAKYRLKDAVLVPIDETMTMIHIPDCDVGWIGTQHVRIRVLAGLAMFESHPLTITNAAGGSGPRGITLYAKVAGDWSKRVHTLAKDKGYEALAGEEEKEEEKADAMDVSMGVGVKVLLDGPYGGLSLDMSAYSTVLLIAGGSGITFALGAAEETMRQRAASTTPVRIQLVWVVRDVSTVEALSPRLVHLRQIAPPSCELIYRFHLTNPTSSPLPTLPFPSDVSPYRPSISQLVRESLPPPTILEIEENDGQPTRTCCSHGGLAVIACGPDGIVAESGNAVASLSVKERVRVGGVRFHGERYAI